MAALAGVFAGLCPVFVAGMLLVVWITNFGHAAGSDGRGVGLAAGITLLFGPQLVALGMAWWGLRPAVGAWCPRWLWRGRSGG